MHGGFKKLTQPDLIAKIYSVEQFKVSLLLYPEILCHQNDEFEQKGQQFFT